MSTAPFLLDTSVLLHLARSSELGTRMTAHFGLDHSIYRPLISIVSMGEIMALAAYRGWGEEKQRFLSAMLSTLVILDINDQSVLDAYVELYVAARRAGSAIQNSNDLWIAATAKAAGAVLLTTDKDFLVFHPSHVPVEYVDPNLASPSAQVNP